MTDHDSSTWYVIPIETTQCWTVVGDGELMGPYHAVAHATVRKTHLGLEDAELEWLLLGVGWVIDDSVYFDHEDARLAARDRRREAENDG